MQAASRLNNVLLFVDLWLKEQEPVRDLAVSALDDYRCGGELPPEWLISEVAATTRQCETLDYVRRVLVAQEANAA